MFIFFSVFVNFLFFFLFCFVVFCLFVCLLLFCFVFCLLLFCFVLCFSMPGGNKVIFSSGARFQPIDFLNVTELNHANSVK